jgi:hypothetical protein
MFIYKQFIAFVQRIITRNQNEFIILIAISGCIKEGQRKWVKMLAKCMKVALFSDGRRV